MSAPSPLPDLHEGDEAAFAEPWQARAFALATRLCLDGRWAWDDFKALLIEEIQARGLPDGSDYHERWLAACERLVAARGLVTVEELAARKRHLARHPPHSTAPSPEPVAIDPPRRG